jgi:hypothetical protein
MAPPNCRAVCTQVAMELDGDDSVAPTERLTRALHRQSGHC